MMKERGDITFWEEKMQHISYRRRAGTRVQEFSQKRVHCVYAGWGTVAPLSTKFLVWRNISALFFRQVDEFVEIAEAHLTELLPTVLAVIVGIVTRN